MAVDLHVGQGRGHDEQVEVFRNAARHLVPGGRFVIELFVPDIRRMPPGQAAVPFHVGEDHVGFDTYDLTTQQGASRVADGSYPYAERAP